MFIIGKSIEADRSVIARRWGRGEGGVTANRNGDPFGGDENVLGLDSGNGCSPLRIY